MRRKLRNAGSQRAAHFSLRLSALSLFVITYLLLLPFIVLVAR